MKDQSIALCSSINYLSIKKKFFDKLFDSNDSEEIKWFINWIKIKIYDLKCFDSMKSIPYRLGLRRVFVLWLHPNDNDVLSKLNPKKTPKINI
jgi:hypothetical protein